MTPIEASANIKSVMAVGLIPDKEIDHTLYWQALITKCSLCRRTHGIVQYVTLSSSRVPITYNSSAAISSCSTIQTENNIYSSYLT